MKKLFSILFISAAVCTVLIALAACGQDNDPPEEEETLQQEEETLPEEEETPPEEEIPEHEKACEERAVIEEIKNRQATLAYNTEFEAYTISYLPENTIDSRVLALVCNPNKKRLDILIGAVNFFGILKDIGEDIPPILGTDYYYVQLQYIQKLNMEELLGALCIGDQTHKPGDGDCPEGEKIATLENLNATFSKGTEGVVFWTGVPGTYDCRITFQVCDQSKTQKLTDGQQCFISGDIYPYTDEDIPGIGGHYIYTIDNLTIKKPQ